jgi:nucleotide-binding universal stress UspA family protein
MTSQIRIPQRMLVGADDSEGSSQAVDYAIELAQKLNSSIVFIHVVTLSDTGKQILEICESKAKERGVPSKSALEVGEPTKVFLSKAEEEKCDCIVIGKMGQPKVAGNLVSMTTAQKLLALSKIPIICV